jgi:hypothetical protein
VTEPNVRYWQPTAKSLVANCLGDETVAGAASGQVLTFKAQESDRARVWRASAFGKRRRQFQVDCPLSHRTMQIDFLG